MTTESTVKEFIKGVKSVTDELREKAQHKIDFKTKPLGSLGKFESLALQSALVQNNLSPEIKRRLMLVFGADHGITEEGVSAFPSEVTAQMLTNFFHGGAAINVFCRAYNVDFKVIDMGVKGEFEDHPVLIKRKVREGTHNFAKTPAMDMKEVFQAVSIGMDVFRNEHSANPVDILGLGEIGIGNTTSATAVICAATGVSVAEATGRGTGLDDKGLSHKAAVIQNALELHKPDPKDGFGILAKVGGFELAGIVGAILAAADAGILIVLDGVISTAAGLIAYLICPQIKGYLISGHKSQEIAQSAALDLMGLDPVLDLDMRLGEGTGAAVTISIVETACKMMREMASFEEAGVSEKL